tara:strand:+ start:760 stop:900 length:141 start_codon:yes stop_codon:yes gene_type:complete
MFLYCPKKEMICAFCGSSNNELRCGIAKGENRINHFTKCPYKPRKK